MKIMGKKLKFGLCKIITSYAIIDKILFISYFFVENLKKEKKIFI